MPGGKERILRRRIHSVQSTKKITKAMELIAASRIVKAQHRLVAARPYSERITEIIANLSRKGAAAGHPLLTAARSVEHTGLVVITADRGLAGAYNSNVIRIAENAAQAQQAAGQAFSLTTVGKKGQGYFAFRKFPIDSSFSGMSEQPTYDDAREVAAHLIDKFRKGAVDQYDLFYTKFVSAGVQEAVKVSLMPIDPSELPSNAAARKAGPTAEYEFEPAPQELMDQLFPRYVEARIYAAMLDAAASEHAARQRAMKAATENAQELITNLKRVMNRARQDSITTEIVEIAGGAEALRQGGGVSQDLLPDDLERGALV